MVAHANLLHNLAYASHAAEQRSTRRVGLVAPGDPRHGAHRGRAAPASSADIRRTSWRPHRFFSGRFAGFAPSRATARRRAAGRTSRTISASAKSPTRSAPSSICRSWRVGLQRRRAHSRATRSSRSTSAFADVGFRWRSFYPVYGLAESTLLVSTGGRDYEPVHSRRRVERCVDARPLKLARARGSSVATRPLVSSGPASFGTRDLDRRSGHAPAVPRRARRRDLGRRRRAWRAAIGDARAKRARPSTRGSPAATGRIPPHRRPRRAASTASCSSPVGSRMCSSCAASSTIRRTSSSPPSVSTRRFVQAARPRSRSTATMAKQWRSRSKWTAGKPRSSTTRPSAMRSLRSLIDRVRAAVVEHHGILLSAVSRAVARRDAKDVERQASSPRVSRRVRRRLARRDRALGRRPRVGEPAHSGPVGADPEAVRAKRRRVGNRHVTTGGGVASRSDLHDRVAAAIGATLRVNPARVGPFDSFASLGMDSLAAVELTAAHRRRAWHRAVAHGGSRPPEPRRALPVHRRRRCG